MCECKIVEVETDDIGPLKQRIEFGPCHASAPQLQARVKQLEETLRVAKEHIRTLYDMTLAGQLEGEYISWERHQQEPMMRQINEALK